MTCRVNYLDRNLCLRQVGVNEILQRLTEKDFMNIANEDITKAVVSLQFCAAQEAGSEAAIHPIFCK